MLQGKRFGSNEEVIAELEVYFESKDESFYKKGMEKLEKRWNECIALEGNYVDKYTQMEKSDSCQYLQTAEHLVSCKQGAMPVLDS